MSRSAIGGRAAVRSGVQNKNSDKSLFIADSAPETVRCLFYHIIVHYQSFIHEPIVSRWHCRLSASELCSLPQSVVSFEAFSPQHLTHAAKNCLCKHNCRLEIAKGDEISGETSFVGRLSRPRGEARGADENREISSQIFASASRPATLANFVP